MSVMLKSTMFVLCKCISDVKNRFQQSEIDKSKGCCPKFMFLRVIPASCFLSLLCWAAVEGNPLDLSDALNSVKSFNRFWHRTSLVKVCFYDGCFEAYLKSCKSILVAILFISQNCRIVHCIVYFSICSPLSEQHIVQVVLPSLCPWVGLYLHV